MASANVDVVEIATQAAEAAGALGSVYTSFKILSVAKDYFRLYEDQRNFYYSTFQNGAEAPLVAEVMSVPLPRYDYAKQAQTVYDSATGALGGQVSDAAGWITRHAKMYNTTRDPYITSLDSDLARLRSDWANYLFRYEEHYIDVMQDIRWQRRIGIHNIGLKQGSYVGSALATSFGEYEDALAGTADAMATLGNGATAYAGYRRGMSDTYADYADYGYIPANLLNKNESGLKNAAPL